MVRLTAAQGRKLLGSTRNKFNVNTTPEGKAARTYNGRCYDSQAEMRYAIQLDQRVKVRDILAWSPQVPIPLVVNGVKIAKMVCDFEIKHVDGSTEFCEIKGYVSAVYSLKLKLLRALMPSIKYTIIPAKEVR